MSEVQLQHEARRLRGWCTALCLFLLAVILLEIATRSAGFAYDAPTGSGGVGDAVRYHELGLELVSTVPVLLQLAALWCVRQSLSDVARGALFTPTLGRMLRQVGGLLFMAALCTLVIVPWLNGLAADRFPRLLEFDVANLVIGGLGLVLMFLAGLFDRAVQMQRDLDEIF